MKNFLLIDGNSIMNRAFYGIMGSNLLTNKDGKYTNALYGFLNILFKNLEMIKPDYICVAFDSKTGANVRKQKYDGYKKSRHGMPDELREQMPEIKEILEKMNIMVIERSDFEGDDILGSVAKKFSNDEVTSYILSGDRDLFQLIQSNINIIIPRTKNGKTETEIYNLDKIKEEYNLTPSGLIELKALMGDSSDEIPGAPGIGPKTAQVLLDNFKTVDGIYAELETNPDNKIFKPKVKSSLIENKDLVYLSKDIGTIVIDADVPENIEDYLVKKWQNDEVCKLFKYYEFKKFVEKYFSGNDDVVEKTNNDLKDEVLKCVTQDIIKYENLKIDNKLIYYFDKEIDNDENKIIKKKIIGLSIIQSDDSAVYVIPTLEQLKTLFEDENIEKIGYDISEDYVMLKELGITMKNIKYDIEVAGYDIDPSNVKHSLADIAMQFLDIDISELLPNNQTSLFEKNDNFESNIKVAIINKIYEVTLRKLSDEAEIKLFNEIEIPLITVLGEMQFNGMKCNKDTLNNFGIELRAKIDELTNKIYDYAGEEFNINSTQQLGSILFDKMRLTPGKKNKKGYSTDVDTLEKIKYENEIIPLILEYRSLTKLNSTYVDGLINCINPRTNRIHSYFHQTITATGRISSTDPNLQNIPAREELGRQIKKAFVPENGYVYIDADYSQVELRVLAALSKDEHMMNAFKNGEDIHKEVASKVFDVPFDEVTKEQRSKAKAVNFGIVYGITSFGLSQQLDTTRKESQEYIDNYLKKYSGVKEYMDEQVKNAQNNGFVTTLFGRKRYIPELKSKNYMVREFGKRVAMNSPIQGTAADIMKIAMIRCFDELKKSGIDARIVLQVHDELLIEAAEKDKLRAIEILKDSMENAVNMDVKLKVDVQSANDWYDAK